MPTASIACFFARNGGASGLPLALECPTEPREIRGIRTHNCFMDEVACELQSASLCWILAADSDRKPPSCQALRTARVAAESAMLPAGPLSTWGRSPRVRERSERLNRARRRPCVDLARPAGGVALRFATDGLQTAADGSARLGSGAAEQPRVEIQPGLHLAVVEQLPVVEHEHAPAERADGGR